MTMLKENRHSCFSCEKILYTVVFYFILKTEISGEPTVSKDV